jgi:hypothetical protein
VTSQHLGVVVIVCVWSISMSALHAYIPIILLVVCVCICVCECLAMLVSSAAQPSTAGQAWQSWCTLGVRVSIITPTTHTILTHRPSKPFDRYCVSMHGKQHIIKYWFICYLFFMYRPIRGLQQVLRKLYTYGIAVI